jgi:dTMP kinase
LETHEPWKSAEIKKKLLEENDAFSGGPLMAQLYVNDRIQHTKMLILPVLQAEGIVISDRYKMSTCAYQWTQGVPLHYLMELHDNPDIITPDLVIYVDVNEEIATKRRSFRPHQKEKFERDQKFLQNTIENYRKLVSIAHQDEKLFGKVVVIDGSKSVEEVHESVKLVFDNIYYSWKLEHK